MNIKIIKIIVNHLLWNLELYSKNSFDHSTSLFLFLTNFNFNSNLGQKEKFNSNEQQVMSASNY